MFQLRTSGNGDLRGEHSDLIYLSVEGLHPIYADVLEVFLSNLTSTDFPHHNEISIPKSSQTEIHMLDSIEKLKGPFVCPELNPMNYRRAKV